MNGLVRAWLDYTLLYLAISAALAAYTIFYPADGLTYSAPTAVWIMPILLAAHLHTARHPEPPSVGFCWAVAALTTLSAVAISFIALIAVVMSLYDTETLTGSARPSAPSWSQFGILHFLVVFAGSGLLFPVYARSQRKLQAKIAGRKKPERNTSPVRDARPDRQARPNAKLATRPERSSGGLRWILLDFSLVYVAILCGFIAFSLRYPNLQVAFTVVMVLWMAPILFASHCHSRRVSAQPTSVFAWIAAATLALTAQLLCLAGFALYASLAGDAAVLPYLNWTLIGVPWFAIQLVLFRLIFGLHIDTMLKARSDQAPA